MSIYCLLQSSSTLLKIFFYLLELIYNSVQQTLLAVPVPFSKYGLNRFFLALMEIVR